MSFFKTTISNHKKVERLKLLSTFNLNTPEYLVIPQYSSIRYAQKEFLSFSSSCDRISIRTQSEKIDDDFGTPKWIDIDVKNAEKIFPTLLDKYTVLVSKAINSKDAIKVCAIAILEDKIIIEMANGGGTVDKITRSGLIDKRYIEDYDNVKNIDDKDIYCLLIELLRTPFINVIYEVSWFPYPVGRLGMHYIIWDITRWS